MRLGEFRIIRRLEGGGFGDVYLARKELASGVAYNKGVYAVKVTEKCPCTGEFEFFRNNVELEVFRRADGHPYLVQLVTFFETEVCSSYLNVCVFRQLTDTEI